METQSLRDEESIAPLDPSILREYDIRGIVGEGLTENSAYAIGKSFGTIVRRKGGKRICLGFDGRESSPALSQAVIEGLLSVGIDVENIGLGPTPMVYFALNTHDADAGVMITGSHSPLAYNGIKMALKSGPFYGDQVQEVGRLIVAGDFEAGQGQLTKADVQNDYVERLLEDYNGTKDLKIAWDSGNGAGGEILRRLVKKLPGEHVLIFDDIDGTFPNHHPDPTVAENLVDLQKVIRAQNCDIGIGFDGDADRIGIVDEQGGIIWADILIAIYAAEVLKAHPGATIISDIKSSRVLFDEIERLGGKPVMWNTGHSLIKAKMKETGSPLAGELAGHICFADKYYGFDDGLYCAVRIIDILSRSGKKLSELTEHLPQMVNTPEIRFEVPADRKFDIAPEILERLRSKNNKEILINDIDGVRVTTEDGWWLMRPSNTEDVLTIRVEAFTEQGLHSLKTDLIDQLAQSGVKSPF